VDAATTEDPYFDLQEAIRATLAEELLTGLTIEADEQGSPS
jgi:replication-associated recombination protein RarA